MLVNEADDDRDTVHPGDRSVLIVENDLSFARVLLESAREQGMKGIVTSQGTAALTLIHEYMPAAILLDIFLPDIEGWRVLSRIKNDPAVRHTPVTVISTEEARERALDSGARSFVAKPIQSRKAVDEVLDNVAQYAGRAQRRMLLVEPDPVRLTTIREYLAGLENVEIVSATDGPRAAELLRDPTVDCAIVNPDTPELDLAAVLDSVRDDNLAPPPVIAYGRQSTNGPGGTGTLTAIRGVHEIHSIERCSTRRCSRCTWTSRASPSRTARCWTRSTTRPRCSRDAASSSWTTTSATSSRSRRCSRTTACRSPPRTTGATRSTSRRIARSTSC
jgi:CheY-like chemotaxis protein